MKKNILLFIVYLCGFLAFLAFLSIRFQPILNIFIIEKLLPQYDYTEEGTRYGELYYSNYIAHFKENIPSADINLKYRISKKHPRLEDADILTFGDSFFDYNRMVTFPEKLSDTLKQKVYFARDNFPLKYLKKNQYKNDKPKFLIYETSERYIADRFSKPHNDSFNIDKRSKLRILASEIWDKIFVKDSEIKYTLLLSRCYLTHRLYSFIATLKFDVFGYIAPATPLYTLKYDTPWLFYYESFEKDSPESFYYNHSEEEIENYCNNISDLSLKLWNDYKLIMVFLPIPSKYTIYHWLINNDTYNNFLPDLFEQLQKRGIPFVNLYNVYMNSSEFLYYGTDTHWNEKGLEIALKETLKVMREIDINDKNSSSLKTFSIKK